MSVDDCITKDNLYCKGMARLEGKMIPVAQIIYLKKEGNTFTEIKTAYDLTKEQINAAITYYKNNKQEIEQDIRRLNSA